MSRGIAIAVLALVLTLAGPAPAQAQFVLGPVYPPAYGGGFGFSYHKRGFHAAGFAGGFYSRSVFVGPVRPVLPPIGMFTPFGYAPGFIEPDWGIGPGWGWFSPPLIVAPPPIILAGGNAERPRKDDGNPALAFEELPRPINELPRGARPEDVIVISPKRDFPAPGQTNPDVDRVAGTPRPRGPVIRFDPFAKPVKVDAELREADPARESLRLVKLGRLAFAAGEYGRAAERFEQAGAIDPKAALPRFLQAHAAFAAGRYGDAVTGIRAGLDLDPAFPASTFDPKEPYGANAAPFAAHLAELRKTIAANPGEPTLEFLLGYQLWFIGEKIEARKWFDAAARRLPAPGPVGLFK